MLMGSSRPKSHIRRTSSVRGLAGDDSAQPPNLTRHLQPHYHQNHSNQITEDQSASSHYASSFLSAMISPRTHNPRRRSSGGGFDQSSFLQTCELCRRRLAAGRDLYMYKGDAAFCSEECREEQMKRDSITAEVNKLDV